MANDITLLSFAKDLALRNHITVTLDAETHSGAGAAANNKSKEHLVTTAIMRSRSAN